MVDRAAGSGRTIPGVLLAAALALAFLTSWIVLPPFHRWLLPLSVGAPEVSAWLLLAGLTIAALGISRRGHPLSRWAIGIALSAAVVAATPLARVPFVARSFDRAMQDALGPEVLRETVHDGVARMRPAPVVVRDLFLGVDTGEALVTRGVWFAAPEGVPLTLDVYHPAAPGPRPCVVQIYGGAWRSGAPGDDAGFATYLASRGYVVFAVDYRHVPRWQWPAQIDDVRAALAWIGSHGGRYGADTSRVALIGRSAGAQLAMVAGYGSSPLPVAAVVNYYGPVDLEAGYAAPPRPDPLDIRAIEEAFLGGTPEQARGRYRDASPIAHVSPRAPPSLLIYGARDHVVLARFGAMLEARLRAAGAVSVRLELPWAEHAFDRVPNGPAAQMALYYTERFLAWALRRGELQETSDLHRRNGANEENGGVRLAAHRAVW